MNAETNTEVRRGPGRPRNEMNDAREPSGRRKRVPLGTPTNKMAASGRKGYVRRWLNDDGPRIQQAQNAGYEFVTEGEAASDGTGTRKSLVVGKKEDGTPLHAFLMEIPQDFYEEDKAYKQGQVDETDEAIKAGSIAGNVGADGRYIPSQGISYKTGRNGRSARSIQPNDGES